MDRPKPQPVESFIWFGVILFVVTLLCALLGCQPRNAVTGGSVQNSEKHSQSASYPPAATQAERATYTVDHPAPPARVETWAVDRTYYPPPKPLVLSQAESSRSTTQPSFGDSAKNVKLAGIDSSGATGSSSATFEAVEAGARANWMWVAIFGVAAVVFLFLKQWLAAIGCVGLCVVATVYPFVFLIGAILAIGYGVWLLYQRTKDAAIQRKAVDELVIGVKEAKPVLGTEAFSALEAELSKAMDGSSKRVVTRAKEKLKGVAK